MHAARELLDAAARVDGPRPLPAPEHPLLGLQRSIGNRATAALAGRALLQRKGPRPLIDQLPPEPRPQGLFASWFAPKPDPTIEVIVQMLRGYDALADERPSVQSQHLATIMGAIGDATVQVERAGSEGAQARLAAIKGVVRAELLIVERQRERLERFTSGANAPFEMMTTEGALWTDPDWELSAPNLGLTGRAYFDALSVRNRAAMTQETTGSGQGEAEWVAAMIQKLTTALQSAVVNHYTTKARAKLMVEGGTLQSKVSLAKNVASFKHNTSAYDDYGLANAGFVFFFIEPPGEDLRGTRFSKEAPNDAKSDPCRISIPIEESGLLSNGWVMLSDFAQREYPTVAAKEAAPSETHSHLETRQKNPDYTLPVRRFQQGIEPLAPEEMEAIHGAAENPQQAQARTTVKGQVRGDPRSTMTYGPGGEGNEYKDRLFQNVLVGGDIIRGLAERAVVETIRISKVNPELGERLKAMGGVELMKFLLKDLLRPQAMVPNSVKIEKRHVEPPLEDAAPKPEEAVALV